MKLSSFLEKLNLNEENLVYENSEKVNFLNNTFSYNKDLIHNVYSIFNIDKKAILEQDENELYLINGQNQNEISAMLSDSNVKISIEAIKDLSDLYLKINSLSIDFDLKLKILLDEAMILYSKKYLNKDFSTTKNNVSAIISEKDFLVTLSFISTLDFINDVQLSHENISFYFDRVFSLFTFNDRIIIKNIENFKNNKEYRKIWIDFVNILLKNNDVISIKNLALQYFYLEKYDFFGEITSLIKNILNISVLNTKVKYFYRLMILTKKNKADLLELSSSSLDLTYWIAYFSYLIFVNLQLEQIKAKTKKNKINLGAGEIDVLLILILNSGQDISIKQIHNELLEKKSLVRLNMIIDSLIEKRLVKLSYNHGKVFYYRTIF